MGKANYVHDGPPPGIGFEAAAPASYSPPASEVTAADDGGSEVPDLLSHLDPANSHVAHPGQSGEGTSEWLQLQGADPLYYSWPWPESRLPHRNYRDTPVL